MKYFRMSYEEVVFNRSYLNIMLLNRSIPSFKTDTDEEDDYRPSRRKRRSNAPAKTFKPISKATSANDFFMGLMG